jgi:flagellar biosynthesis chaperone FliJ
MDEKKFKEVQVKVERLKKIIDDLTTEKNKLEGALDSTKERLKKDYDIKSVNGLQKELANLEQELDALSESIEDKIKELENTFEF